MSISITIGEPLQAAREALAARGPVGSPFRTAEWDLVDARIREQAFFSATVEDVRYLEAMKARLEERINVVPVAGRSTMDKAKFVQEMQALAQLRGLRPEDRKAGRGRMTDVGSRKRLELIWDIQVGLAEGRARWLAATDPDIIEAVPAWEFRRVGSRKEWRDWPRRWVAAGMPAPTAPGGDYGVRMIALKTDPGWARLSRFGLPWAPFDFGSGMGLRDIRRKEAVALGLMSESSTVMLPPEEPEPMPVVELPKVTRAGADLVRQQFGDMASADTNNNTVSWDGKAVSATAKAVANKEPLFLPRSGPGTFSLGATGAALAAMLAVPAQVSSASELVITADTKAEGVSEADMRALMVLWRNGQAKADGGKVILTLDLPGGKRITAEAYATGGRMQLASVKGGITP